MEDENLSVGPMTLENSATNITPSGTGYDAFQKWANSLGNQGLSAGDINPGLPSV